MATVHDLTLRAKLDSKQVQQELDQLAQRSGAGEQASGAARDVGGFADSIKKLRHAVGGNAMVQSFTDLAKATKMFGDSTDQVVSQINSAVSKISQAVATGNPAIIAFTVAMEALSFAAGNEARRLAEQRMKYERRTKELEDAMARGQKFKDSLLAYREQRAVESTLGSGDAKFLSALRDSLLRERGGLEEKLADAERRAGAPGQYGEDILARAKTVDGWLKQVDQALEKQAEAEKKKADLEDKRVKGLNEARGEFQTKLAAKAALKAGDEGYFGEAMDQAKRAMEKATTAEDYRKAEGDYFQAGSSLESLRSRAPQGMQEALKLLAGKPVSGFSSQGFSMGEKESNATIESKMDEIIQLLVEEVRKDLNVYNISNNVI